MFKLLAACVTCSLSSVAEGQTPFTFVAAVPVDVPAQVNAGMAVKLAL